jgi:hypothetical protein
LVSPDFQLMTPHQLKRFWELDHDLSYFRDDRRIKIELHWRFSGNHGLLPVDLDIFRATTQTPVAGYPIPSLGPEGTMLYLLVHGAHHAWRRLFWLTDVAEMMRHRSDLDWSNLIQTAAQIGISRPVGQGVILAHLLLEAPIPEPVRPMVESGRALSYLVREALRQILLPMRLPPLKELQDKIIMTLFYEPKLLNGLGRKIKVLRGDAFLRPEDWEVIRLPDSLFPLYYFLRPFSWLIRRLRREPS